MTERQRQKPPARKAASDAPTLQDVAQAAGVSTATVSRCLNSPQRVVKETRDRVLAVVDKLGYAPNFGARALAAKRTNTIGAIIPTMENAIFARGLQAFQEELARHGLTLLVASSSYRPDLEEEQIRTLLARGADALLLIGFERAARVYELLDQRSVPYVVAWAFDEAAQHPAIGFDNRQAMQVLARQVFDLGHREVAIITAPLAPNDRARDRVSGVWDAAREVGLSPDEIVLIETPYSIENGAAAMKSLLERAPGTTAVMCGNDVLAVGAMGQAQSMGRSVPGDISITGFDDIEIAGIVTPPLTTVHVPHRQMGKQAAQVLSALLGGTKPGAPVRLQTEIISRASLGVAPG